MAILFVNPVLETISDSASLADLLDASANRFNDRVALQWWQEERVASSLTYSELRRLAMQKAECLQQLGIQPGYRIGIVADNSLHWCVAFFAIMYCRASAVLIDPNLEESDCLTLIRKSDPQLILTNESSWAKKLKDHPDKFPIYELERLAVLGTMATCPESSDQDSSVAVLMFTSGTTGDLKAACLDHKSLLYAVKGGIEAVRSVTAAQVLGFLPLTHIFGLEATLLVPLAVGATVTYIDRPQGETILKAMRHTHTTLLPLVPRVVELFFDKIHAEIAGKPKTIQRLAGGLGGLSRLLYLRAGLDAGRFFFAAIHRVFGSKLQFMVSGGAPLDGHHKDFFDGIGIHVIQGYGLTETAGISCFCQARDRKAEGVGKPPPWLEIHIQAPIEGVGEICLKGPTLMRRYFRNPDATAAAMEDGWFHSGDRGRLTERGDLIICGRIKEMIITSSGYKAMPEDVESRYKDLPGVLELAVCGVPMSSESMVEGVHAAVTVDEDYRRSFSSEAELVKDLNAKFIERSSTVPFHLRITKIHILGAIPKTPTLKVKRGILRQTLQDLIRNEKTPRPKNQDSLLEEGNQDQETRAIIELVKSIAIRSNRQPMAALGPKTSFQIDLDFDSLMNLELLLGLEEKFHIRFALSAAHHLQTIGDLIETVKQQQSSAETPAPRVRKLRRLLLQSDGSEEKAMALHYCRDRFIKRSCQALCAFPIKWFYNYYLHLKPAIGSAAPPAGPFILISNHTSHLDALALVLASGRPVNDFVVLGAKDYFFGNGREKAGLGAFFNLLPISRSGNVDAMISNLNVCRSCVELGKSLILFPEGTRSTTGELLPFKSLLGIISAEVGIPIVPAYISGNYQSLPKGRTWPRPGTVRVAIGECIQPGSVMASAADLEDSIIYKEIVDKAYQAVLDLKNRQG